MARVDVQIFDAKKTSERICGDRRVGMFVAETCARHFDQYVPFDTGMLAQNYITKPFQIVYNQIYAHRQYTGDGFNFNHEKHPLATSHWDVPAMEAHGNTIAREVSAYIRAKL